MDRNEFIERVNQHTELRIGDESEDYILVENKGLNTITDFPIWDIEKQDWGFLLSMTHQDIVKDV